VGNVIAYFYKGDVLKDKLEQMEARNHSHAHVHDHDYSNIHGMKKVVAVLNHAIDEFFDTGRFLIIGFLIASAMQTYLPTHIITTKGYTKVFSILVLMVLAFTMSLCSEADAFIGSSLLSLFGTGPIVGFLVFGPMVDIKNLMMMNRYFKFRFIALLIGMITVTTLVYAMLV
jgi:uncharacterized membrane protein YraQ (UPF0718 family)